MFEKAGAEHHQDHIAWIMAHAPGKDIDFLLPTHARRYVVRDTFICNWLDRQINGQTMPSSYLGRIAPDIPALYLGAYWGTRYGTKRHKFEHMDKAAQRGQLKQLSFPMHHPNEGFENAFINVAFWLARKDYPLDGFGYFLAKCCTPRQQQGGRTIRINNVIHVEHYGSSATPGSSGDPGGSGVPARTSRKTKKKHPASPRNHRNISPTESTSSNASPSDTVIIRRGYQRRVTRKKPLHSSSKRTRR